MELKFIERQTLKPKPADESKLVFGHEFTDYMLMMRYDAAKGGWYEAQIEPFGDIALSPAATCLHYSQEVFEGMKAYRAKDGRILMFRPWDNIDRMFDSSQGLCMAAFDKEFVLNAIYELIRVEKDWIPSAPGTSLYIRPTFIGVQPVLGVHPASQYMLYVILSPVSAYYACGLAPVKIYVEPRRVRAVKGGVGLFKTGGNYAASLYASDAAEKRGYSQVLWLDGKENRYVEEVGSMNLFVKMNGELITPPLEGSILPGITRRSIIELARSMGETVVERRIDINEVFAAAENGTLEEVFGTGTAAVVSPVGELCMDERRVIVNGGGMGELTKRLYDTLTGIQFGDIEDKFGWTIAL